MTKVTFTATKPGSQAKLIIDEQSVDTPGRGENALKDLITAVTYMLSDGAKSAILEYDTETCKQHWKLENYANITINVYDYDPDSQTPVEGKRVFHEGCRLAVLAAALVEGAEAAKTELADGFPEAELSLLKQAVISAKERKDAAIKANQKGKQA
jgi:hypothetical protein